MHASGEESRVTNFRSFNFFEVDLKFEETFKEFFLRFDVERTLFSLFFQTGCTLVVTWKALNINWSK